MHTEEEEIAPSHEYVILMLPNDIKREILSFMPSLSLNRFQNGFLNRNALFPPDPCITPAAEMETIMSPANYSVNYHRLIRLLYGYFADESALLLDDQSQKEEGTAAAVPRSHKNFFLIFPSIDLTVYNGKGDFMTIFTDEYVQRVVPWYQIKSLTVAPGHHQHHERLTSHCLSRRQSDSNTWPIFPHLHHLSLLGNANVNDQIIDSIIYQFPNLKHVNISGTGCSYRSVVSLLQLNRYKSVQSNAIWGMSVKEHHMEELLLLNEDSTIENSSVSSGPHYSLLNEQQQEPILTDLELHRNQVGGGIAHILNKFRNLKTLRIGHNQLTDLDLEKATVVEPRDDKNSLKLLDLGENGSIGDRGIEMIMASPIFLNLTSLSVAECSISDSSVGLLLSGLKKLKRIDISSNELLTYKSILELDNCHNRNLSYFNASCNPNIFANTHHTPDIAKSMFNIQIEQYILLGSELDDNLFIELNRLSSLHNNKKLQIGQLHLDDNPGLTIRGVSELLNVCDPSSLSSLLLDGCKDALTPDDMISTQMIAQQFNSMTRLSHLDLTRVRGCTDEFATLIILNNHKLKALGMSHTRVGDAFLRALAHLERQSSQSLSLDRLNLKFNRKITSDAVCDLIQSNRTLNLIDIEGMMMDQDVLETLSENQNENRFVTIDGSVKFETAQTFRQLIENNFCFRRCSIFY